MNQLRDQKFGGSTAQANRPGYSHVDRQINCYRNRSGLVDPGLTQFKLTTCTKHDPDIFLDFLTSDGNWSDIIAYTNDSRLVSDKPREYLLRSRAHAPNDCIFEKDHLKVVDTRDAAFTAIVEPRLRYTSALLSSTQNVHLGQDSPAVRYSEIR